jgi:hypothetical protein
MSRNPELVAEFGVCLRAKFGDRVFATYHVMGDPALHKMARKALGRRTLSADKLSGWLLSELDGLEEIDRHIEQVPRSINRRIKSRVWRFR